MLRSRLATMAVTLSKPSSNCQADGPFSLTHKHFFRISGSRLRACARVFPGLISLIMTIRLAASAVALLLVLAPVSASDQFVSLDSLRPGMKGVGRTVWEGTRVEEFTVSVIGVLENVTGPQRHLVLARLEGGPLAQTGVIAGMSGSPVYIDGKLLGAVSYSLGSFSKEAIAGITPIQEMIEAAQMPAARPAINARARLEVPITREGVAAALKQAFSWAKPFAVRPGDVQLLSLAPDADRLDGRIGTFLRPIATPLLMGGFGAETRDTVANVLQDSAFLPVTAAAAAIPSTENSDPIRPGDALGINLITGDLLLGATGTITHVDGDRVYAFGHPFYNLGPTAFPMTRAYVHTLLPSLLSSMKISSTGAIIGTVQQDRATTIAGVIGKGPTLIPIKISLDTERGLKKTFEFSVVNDQLFTPLLTYMSVLNTLSQYEREFGAATFSVKGKATVKNHGEVGFEDLFTGDSPSVGAAAYVAAPITFLLGNDYEPVEIEGLDLSITSVEQPRTATLERVWVDAVRPRAGRTVPLKVLMRTYRGEELTRTVSVDIPANASGPLSILVSDGSRLSQWEQREVRQPLQPRGVQQMIRALNNARKNNRLYVRLLSDEAGAVVNGELLSALPPSVLEVLEGDRHSGNFVPLRSATLGEWELTTDHAVTGSRLLTINVDPN